VFLTVAEHLLETVAKFGASIRSVVHCGAPFNPL
jgi:hypothetical protein